MDVTTDSKHTLLTRIAHMGLAIAVVVQLLTSLVLVPLSPTETPNTYFYIHNYSGLTPFAFVLLFWIFVVSRKAGTSFGLLVPWTSGARMKALWNDLTVHLRMLIKLKLPPVSGNSPFASAIHGLGLLLILAMATSGTIYYFINAGNPDAGGLVGVVNLVHKTLANLVWVYLIDHALMAVAHHFAQQQNLTNMWSLGK